MLYTCLSENEKRRFCSILMAAVSEDQSITEGEQDALIRERIELDVSDISSDIPYEEAIAWLSVNSSVRAKRAMLLEIAILLYNDTELTDEEGDLLHDMARRFKIDNLPDFIAAGKRIGAAYASADPLFADYL